MKRSLLRIFHCQKGATAIEYSLIAVAVALTIAASVFLFSDQVIGLFNMIGNAFDDRL